MARQYKNDKGFLIIEMTRLEAQNICEFGCRVSRGNNIIVCDNCNTQFDHTDNIYYFAALNRAFCKECCDDIIANQDRYDEDIPYEVRHYNFYAEKLNLDKV